MNILKVGNVDVGGGAATVASGLARGYRERGCRVWHVVGQKTGDHPDTLALPDDRRVAYRLSGYAALQQGLRRMAARYPGCGWGLLGRASALRPILEWLPSGAKASRTSSFRQRPTSWISWTRRPRSSTADNLHGGYFDRRRGLTAW